MKTLLYIKHKQQQKQQEVNRCSSNFVVYSCLAYGLCCAYSLLLYCTLYLKLAETTSFLNALLNGANPLFVAFYYQVDTTHTIYSASLLQLLYLHPRPGAMNRRRSRQARPPHPLHPTSTRCPTRPKWTPKRIRLPPPQIRTLQRVRLTSRTKSIPPHREPLNRRMNLPAHQQTIPAHQQTAAPRATTRALTACRLILPRLQKRLPRIPLKPLRRRLWTLRPVLGVMAMNCCGFTM